MTTLGPFLRLRDRLRGLLRRQAVLRDIDDELRSHIELAASCWTT